MNRSGYAGMYFVVCWKPTVVRAPHFETPRLTLRFHISDQSIVILSSRSSSGIYLAGHGAEHRSICWRAWRHIAYS